MILRKRSVGTGAILNRMITPLAKKTNDNAYRRGPVLVVASGFPRGWAARRTCERVLRALARRRIVGRRVRVVLSVSAANAREMAWLNFEHRRRRGPTDVLSFEQKGVRAPRGVRFLGDLVVCLPVARAQAKEHGHGVRAELAALVTHGVLHLLGFDHERSAGEAKKMGALEREILDRVTCGQKSGRAGLIARARAKEKP